MGYIFVTREQECNGLNVIDGLTELTVIIGLTATLSFYRFVFLSARLFVCLPSRLFVHDFSLVSMVSNLLRHSERSEESLGEYDRRPSRRP